jgi:hypothetical protein
LIGEVGALHEQQVKQQQVDVGGRGAGGEVLGKAVAMLVQAVADTGGWREEKGREDLVTYCGRRAQQRWHACLCMPACICMRMCARGNQVVSECWLLGVECWLFPGPPAVGIHRIYCSPSITLCSTPVSHPHQTAVPPSPPADVRHLCCCVQPPVLTFPPLLLCAMPPPPCPFPPLRQLYHLRHARDYEELGLPMGASKIDIKKAYK